MVEEGIEVFPAAPFECNEGVDSVIWIADAKFRPMNGITTSDYLTMLGYLEDFGGANDPIIGTFFYVRGDSPSPVELRHTVNHLKLRPANRSTGTAAIRSLLENDLQLVP